MRLYLAQHGEAKAEEEDPDRPLTDRGASDVRRVARHVAATGAVAITQIHHSGKTRARQTAEAWAQALSVSVAEADGLAPKDDPAIWAARVTGEPGDVLLVGHLPHLSKLAALLVAGNAERPVVAFRPGGVVALEQGDDGWMVLLALPPDLV
jgi:phosphohistidine phosphatase